MKRASRGTASSSIAVLCALAITGCATLAEPSTPASTRFVYSPYKYVPLDFDARSGVRGPPLPFLGRGDAPLPAGVRALTLAFATGECGDETWDGIDADAFARASVSALERAGIDYIVSTGGEAGTFTCATESGMERFIARYASSRLVGLDFDIERGQSAAVVSSLVERIRAAKRRHPGLRISFTLATWAGSDGGAASLNADGERVMIAIRESGLADAYINLMVMDYGAATPGNCVVRDAVCDMGRSGIQAALNLNVRYGVPLARIELTPMIGVNDVMSNVFTLDDAAQLGAFVRERGLGGLHFWSLDRDTPCAAGGRDAASTCSGVDAPPRAFSEAFARQLR